MLNPEHSIYTFTGRRFWPLEPRAQDVSIDDIAHALSNQCRFTGHVTRFYSVAQHSVLVSNIVSPRIALWGLLHDASEAYMSDLASPIKGQPEMAFYKVAESRIMQAVAEAFSLPWPHPPEVKIADRILLVTEKRDVMPRRTGEFNRVHTGGEEPLPYPITPWSPEVSEKLFLRRFAELTTCPLGTGCYDPSTRAVIDAADAYADGRGACGLGGCGCGED